MSRRAVAIGITVLAAVVEVGWLAAGGSIGAFTAVFAGSAVVVAVTGGRWTVLNGIARIVLGLAFLASVADRFGLLGGPGAAGVSWGNFANFVAYTGELVPGGPGWLDGALAVLATVCEAGLGILLVFGVRPRTVAALAAGMLAIFALAMLTSVGFGAMSAYAVPVLAGGAAVLATAESTPRFGRRPALARRADAA